MITGHLVAALRGQEEFRTANHAAYIQERMEDVQNRSYLWAEEALVDTIEGAPVQVARRLRRATKTGA